ncbi:MAG: hypothetical protein M3N41_03285 [Acidobacteriota bacterium]|nr:hypothetical protein [Acidobacteriota bacterium]
MRLALFAIFTLGTAALGQQHGATGSYGNVLHPGVPSPATLRPPSPASRPSIGSSFTRGRRSFGGAAVYVPYPIYGYGYGFDNFYPGGYAPPYAPEPPAPPDAPTPPVIVNQNFQTEPVHPQFRDYTNVPLPEHGTVLVPPGSALADDQPTVFLIAMNDRTILPVIAYWVDGATLHYVTLQSVPNQVSMDQVDRDFSRKLNADRHVPFALPAAR